MSDLEITTNILSYLEYVEGNTPKDKMLSLIASHFIAQLQECEEEIREYELKYGMTFHEFVEAWERDEIPKRWSHSVERDYMEWEGLEAERKKWLSLLKSLPSAEMSRVSVALSRR